MAMQQTSSDLNKRETGSLIGSDKVEGTDVYNPNGDRVGTIERVMIDKISGKVAYAVLSFGGFLGMGEDYYPVPWATLKYDTKLGGYVLGLTRDELEQAPKYSESQGWNWSRENDQRVYDYYRTEPYWS
jgi:sporulation protein YlmC with PRC-barrel domain